MRKRRILKRLQNIASHRPPSPMEIDCLNCGFEVRGSYCPSCGQAISVSRYTFRGLGNEIYNQFKKFEVFSAIRTVWALFHHPGNFVRSYLEGQRVGHLAPFKFFFYTFVLQIFVGAIIHTVTGNDTSFLTQGTDLRTQLIDLVSIVFWGLCWRLVFRSSGLNAAENIVAAIYFTGEAFVFTLLIRIICGPFMNWSPSMPILVVTMDLTVYLIYSFFFSYRLFRETGLQLFLKQVILVVAYAAITLIIIFATVFGESLTNIPPSGGQ